MRALLGRRLLALVPVGFGITLAVFLILRLVPGTPAQAILGLHGTPASIAKLDAELGVHRSLLAQYWLFLGRLAHGDLGDSYVHGQPVMTLVASALGPTLWLVLYAVVLSVLIAVPLGVLAALRRGSLSAHAIRVGVALGLGLPGYWVGLALLWLLAIVLPIFPVGGYGETSLAHLFHLFLPALTLAMSVVPLLLRALRASVIDALQAKHVAAARAKGQGGLRLIARHVLRNALVPFVELVAVHLAWLVGGTVIVESVFGAPGLGTLLVRAIASRDYPVVQGVTLVIAVLTVLIQLLADLTQAWLDPRITASSA